MFVSDLGLEIFGLTEGRRTNLIDAFNPQSDLNEWIQNDWESDDFDEQELRANMERIWESNRQHDYCENEQMDLSGKSIFALLFVVLGSLSMNPVFWVVMILAILVLGH